MRFVAGVAAALLLAGCGSAVQSAGAPVVADTTAPPLTAVDEAPPEDVLWWIQEEFPPHPTGSSSTDQSGGLNQVCIASVGVDWASSGTAAPPAGAMEKPCPEPTPEELAKMVAEERRYHEAIRPAPDSPPRVVAKLALQDGGEELFTAWHNGAGELCWQVDEVTTDGSSGGGPNGPCVDAQLPATGMDVPRCATICLASGTTSDSNVSRYVLTGTVAADADALRITRAGGAVITYPLSGPIVGGERRVFMVELGTNDWRKLELVRDGDVVATEKMPAFMAAYEDCEHSVGPMPQPAPNADAQPMLDSMRAYSRQIDACVRTSGALPPALFPTPPR
jgi:hypothetical protein